LIAEEEDANAFRGGGRFLGEEVRRGEKCEL
jgi:hypothetical protein